MDIFNLRPDTVELVEDGGLTDFYPTTLITQQAQASREDQEQEDIDQDDQDAGGTTFWPKLTLLKMAKLKNKRFGYQLSTDTYPLVLSELNT